MLSFRIILACICLWWSANAQASWKSCSSPAAHGKIESLTIAPNPPQKGAQVTITGKGALNEKVATGSYTTKIKYNSIPIFVHSGDICKNETIVLPLGMGTIKTQGLPCPTAVGEVELQQIASIAKTAPSGDVTVEFSAKDGAGGELLCLDVDLRF